MSCGSDPSWATTPAAYTAANTDNKLRSWWNSQQQTYFAKQLAQSFGDQPTWFDCGIGRAASCSISGCAPYKNSNDDPWAYEAAVSVVNLNAYFNEIYTGVTNGQLDYTNEILYIAQTFMPSDQTFVLGDGAPWIVAVIAIIFSLGLFFPPGAEFAGLAAGALLTGAVTTAQDQLDPGPVSHILSVTDMQHYARTFGESTRDMISGWANSTFLGHQDQANQTILDYMRAGTFVDSSSFPSAKDIESFYMKQMVSRTVNTKWKDQQIFGLFTQTPDDTDVSGPNNTRYYSKEDGGTYYVYQFFESGRLSSHLDQPAGLDKLNGSYFGISGNDISKASAKSFRLAKFNYTDSVDGQQLRNAVISNNSISPIKDGAGWAGTWTVPICDTGTYNWNSQYGDTSSRYGKLPCCCGPKCADTAAFLKAANLQGSQTLLRGCYEQLKDTYLDFNQIDYGYSWQTNFNTFWAGSSDGIRAGVVIGMLGGSFLAILVIMCTCVAIFN